jgi:hypothetical protein
MIGYVEIVEWFDCDGDSDNCHITMDADFSTDDDYDCIEDFMSEHGWLIVGEQCFCPECKKLMI